MNANAAYQAYKSVQVNTASQGELIIMLFDGAVRMATQADHYIEQGNIAGANEKLLRVQDIMFELISALNMDTGEIAKNLYQLYDFVNQLLIKANVTKDREPLQQALKLLTELRDMWREVVARV